MRVLHLRRRQPLFRRRSPAAGRQPRLRRLRPGGRGHGRGAGPAPAAGVGHRGRNLRHERPDPRAARADYGDQALGLIRRQFTRRSLIREVRFSEQARIRTVGHMRRTPRRRAYQGRLLVADNNQNDQNNAPPQQPKNPQQTNPGQQQQQQGGERQQRPDQPNEQGGQREQGGQANPQNR